MTPPIPTISVVIPAYNSARYLPAAVESVLRQTVRDVEVVVVDDGSTDDTPAVMAGYGPPVRYVRQPNGGVSAARNRGIAEARGRYIAFLDADDTWLPGKLEHQMAVLRDHPGRRLCYSAFTVVDADLRPISERHSQRAGTALEDLLLSGNVIGSICTVVCERDLFATAGGFDPALSQCADWDMWVRLARLTEFVYLDEPLVTYRQHASNMSRGARLLEQDSLRVLEKGFADPGLPANLRGARRRAFGRNYRVLAGTYFQAKLYRDFLRCAALGVGLDPRQIGYLLAYPARVLARHRATRAS
jgi:glycosyltransferase involved in cell wall biosynthesis